MVLNQNEYTMVSLGFNYLKPPLFLPNQTHPSLHFLTKPSAPPFILISSSVTSLLLPLHLLRPPLTATMEEGAVVASFVPSLSPENPPCSLRLLLCSSSSGRRTAVTGDGGVDAVGLTSLSSFSFLPFFLSLGRSVSLLSQSFSGGFLRFPAKWAADGGGFR